MKKAIKKILTFSFDDGNLDDVRLIEILNKYGLKGTFNLNSGSLTECNRWMYNDKKEVRHINYYEHSKLYDGHEIACHSYTHPHLEQLDEKTVYNEIALDKALLSYLFNCEIHGMAYPFGTFNDSVVRIVDKCGFEYSRAVYSTFDFSLPENPLIWNPTCHFKNPKIYELNDRFLNESDDEVKLFYIWGHSYELTSEDEWKAFEELCKKLSGKDDIYYCTNYEAIKYLKMERN